MAGEGELKWKTRVVFCSIRVCLIQWMGICAQQKRKRILKVGECGSVIYLYGFVVLDEETKVERKMRLVVTEMMETEEAYVQALRDVEDVCLLRVLY